MRELQSTQSEIHGIVLTISHILIATSLPVYLFYSGHPYALYFHAAACYVGSVMVIIMAALAIKAWDIPVTPDYTSAHSVLGVIYMAIAIFNVLSGSFKLLKFFDIADLEPQSLRKLHPFLGQLFFLIGIVNVVGMWAYDNKIAALVITAIILGVILILQVVLLSTNAKYAPVSIHKENSIDTLDQIQFQEKEHAYFLFEDVVYEASGSNFEFSHPGGMAIIKSIRGREIDRFIFGMYGIEDNKNSYPFYHEDNVFTMMGLKPSYRIRQTDAIKNSSFELKARQQVSPDTFLFQFGNGESREPLTRIDQIGKYFTVYFDKKVKRLYTQVAFMNETMLSKVPAECRPGLIAAKGLPLLIKIYEGGKFTQKLKDMKIDERLTIEGPRGRGLELQRYGTGEYVVVAAGTGLFPFMDLFYLLLVSPSLFQGYIFHVFLKFRGKNNFYFHELIEGLASRQPKRVRLYVETESKGNFSKTVLEAVKDRSKSIKRVYVCGPPGLNYEAPEVLRPVFGAEKIHLV